MASTRAEVLAASRLHGFPHERGYDSFQANQMKNIEQQQEEEGSGPGQQGQQSRGRPAQRGNVSRIKSMFQDAQQEDNRLAYNRNQGGGLGGGFGGQRSPEVKRKRGDLVIDMNKQSSSSVIGNNKKNSDVPSTLDTNLVDPQKFFESTSHVQRFQFTRAIFAQMEQKTKEEQQRQKSGGVGVGALGRKSSPNRAATRALSPSASRSPVRGGYEQSNRKLTHPVSSSMGTSGVVDNHVTKLRSTSDPSRFDDNHRTTSSARNNVTSTSTSRPNIPNKPDYLARSTRIASSGSTADSSYGKRSGSVDRLDNDFTRRRLHQEESGIQNRNLDSQRNSMSRSDSDLTREFSSAEHRDNDEPTGSTRYLKQRYEAPDTGSRTRSSSQDSRSNRLHSGDAFSSAARKNTYTSDSSLNDKSHHPNRPTSPNRPQQHSTTSSFMADHSYNKPGRSGSGSTSEDSVFGNNTGQPDSTSAANKRGSAEDTSLSARYRRLSQDEIKNAEKDHERLASWRRLVNKPDPASSGVLLHKRRSREEKGLSKEDIEASLGQADSYWQGKFANLPETSEAVDQTNTMTDSTYSSGSGEEMARSESGHNLVTSGPSSPLDPPDVKRRSWGPRGTSPTAAGAKRSSRGSDVMDDKVADEIAAQVTEANNKRNSQEITDRDDLTYRYSSGSDKFVEKAEEATGYHSAHSSEENNPFSRSSSEQSVIKRLSYTDDPEQHNGGGLNTAPPPYPLGSATVSVANSFNSQNIPSPPPYTSPNSTPRLGDGTGQLAHRFETGVGGEGDGPYPAAPNAPLKQNLGIRKVPSPNESIESMTLSEQEALLSKA